MKTKITKSFFIALAVMWAIIMLTTTSKAQTVYVSLDTLQDGDTIHYCTSDYGQVVLYSPTAAATGLHWEIQYPVSSDFFTDSITLNTTNSGPIWFSSNQTPLMALHFFLVGVPSYPGFVDINACGDTYGYLLDALSPNTGSVYTWSTGANTQSITVTSPGIYWVHVDDGCGVVDDTAIVTVDNSNDVNLGPDKTACLNATITLTTGNTNVATYAWSTGESTPTIDVVQSDIYSVTTTDSTGCVSADTITVTFVPPTSLPLCAASFHPPTQKNKLVWDITNQSAQDVIILKRNLADNLETVDTVTFATGEWIDYASNPQTEENGYAIMIMDTCGNASDTSAEHITVWLQISDYLGEVYFEYTPYQGASVPTYTLFGIDNLGSIDSLTSRPATFLNLLLPDSVAINYQKFFMGFPITCSSKSIITVQSNIVNGVTGIDEQALAGLIKIYPTPTDGQVNIVTDLEIQNIQVYNTVGQLILTTNIKNFDLSGNRGLYFVHIITDKGVVIKKVIVQ